MIPALPRYGRSIEDRLFSRMMPEPNSGCWLWIGGTNQQGYGQITVRGHTVRTHRLVWELSRRETVPAGLDVLHTCDTRSCVNPVHLFLGTHTQNMRDASRKGRLRVRGTLMNATHCEKGHERTPKNTYRWRSERHCRPCHAAAVLRSKEKA